MRPLFNKESLWTYPAFGGCGAAFGYWLQGVEQRQFKMLDDRKQSLLEKRRRKAEREANDAEGAQKSADAATLAATS
jgi:hypothetical protein